MKDLLSMMSALLLAGNVLGTDVSGNLYTRTTQDLAGSPCMASADRIMNNGLTLAADSNAIVKFKTYTAGIDGTEIKPAGINCLTNSLFMHDNL